MVRLLWVRSRGLRRNGVGLRLAGVLRRRFAPLDVAVDLIFGGYLEEEVEDWTLLGRPVVLMYTTLDGGTLITLIGGGCGGMVDMTQDKKLSDPERFVIFRKHGRIQFRRYVDVAAVVFVQIPGQVPVHDLLGVLVVVVFFCFPSHHLDPLVQQALTNQDCIAHQKDDAHEKDGQNQHDLCKQKKYCETSAMSDNSGGMMIVVISMMIMSSCVSSSISSGVFVGANENWFTGQLFDWMDVGWWANVKSWFGLSTPPPTTVAAGADPTTTAAPGTGGGDGKLNESKYKDNCVYVYSDKDAKSGFVNSLCVDSKTPQRFWNRKIPTNVKSYRIGKEVKLNNFAVSHSLPSLSLNGQDVNKPVNLSDSWQGRVSGMSAEYKSYDSKGNLQNVGAARDEKAVYLYGDENGKAFLNDIQSKASGDVILKQSQFKHLNYTSSMRVGKNTEVFLYGGGKSQRFQGSGTKNVINLSPHGFNDNLTEIRVKRR